MALDAKYVVSIDLEEYLVDNATSAPLSYGSIEFWKDDNRTSPKLVYELSGAPPNYTYTALPNPINLSVAGTVTDSVGNNVAIYYYPYDANGDIELYYIVVKNSFGVVQFTREAWPNIVSSNSPGSENSNISNELSNPQFVDINFSQNNPLTIPFTGSATMTVAIAPKWDLIISHIGSGSVVVSRNAISGSSAYPGNPPYTLTVTAGANVSSLYLRQRLLNNPDIFSPAVGGNNGYIAASVLLAPSSNLSIQYQPNGLSAQTILAANNISGSYAESMATIQLSGASNPSTGDTGYVDILVILPIVGSTTLSNLQIVGLDTNITTVGYEQNTVNRQRDQLFNYYSPLLQAKPIPSYLVGWDFPLNPTQALGPTISASSAGANTSAQIWDQTILFQSVNSGAAVSRSASGNGALTITATNATKFALIQYLPQNTAREILNTSLSANIAAITASAGGLVGTISLWYTTGSLPNTGSNNSLVATLDANGYPATFNGTWVEVTRNGLGNAQFNVGSSSTTNFNDYGFAGWNLNGAAGADTATFFAIVVGFASLPTGHTIDIGSISLVPGGIPTRPAPQSPDEVLRQCQRYYSSSFNAGVVPATAAGYLGTVEMWTTGTIYAGGFFSFPVSMYAVPTITFYNPVNNNAQFYVVTASTDCNSTATTVIGENGFGMTAVSANTGQNRNTGAWSADCRLGL